MVRNALVRKLVNRPRSATLIAGGSKHDATGPSSRRNDVVSGHQDDDETHGAPQESTNHAPFPRGARSPRQQALRSELDRRPPDSIVTGSARPIEARRCESDAFNHPPRRTRALQCGTRAAWEQRLSLPRFTRADATKRRPHLQVPGTPVRPTDALKRGDERGPATRRQVVPRFVSPRALLEDPTIGNQARATEAISHAATNSREACTVTT